MFAGVGERTREGNDLYREMIESGVIKLGDQQMESKCALVYGQMNEPPGSRARVGLTGLTVAEHFRDAEGQDVLLFVDNIFRFTQVKHISTIKINTSLSRNPIIDEWFLCFFFPVGELRGVCFVGTYSVGRRIPADVSDGSWRPSGAYYDNQERIHYISASYLRAGR